MKSITNIGAVVLAFVLLAVSAVQAEPISRKGRNGNEVSYHPKTGAWSIDNGKGVIAWGNPNTGIHGISTLTETKAYGDNFKLVDWPTGFFYTDKDTTILRGPEWNFDNTPTRGPIWWKGGGKRAAATVAVSVDASPTGDEPVFSERAARTFAAANPIVLSGNR